MHGMLGMEDSWGILGANGLKLFSEGEPSGRAALGAFALNTTTNFRLGGVNVVAVM